uniref:Uncharacterized protein n=1 Tax=Cyanoderma ruficeps TaxID=181631 RepID=A0A8C3NQV5_9PASS
VGGQVRGTTHPEVLGVHVQLVAVQLGQLGKGVLDAVQVLDGLPEGGEHLLAMGLHLGVADDGGGAGQVPEGGEEPLCPGVDDQQPGERHGHSHTEAPVARAVTGRGSWVPWGCCPAPVPSWRWEVGAGDRDGAHGHGNALRGLDDLGAKCLCLFLLTAGGGLAKGPWPGWG